MAGQENLILSCKGVKKSYITRAREIKVLNGVDLEVRAGDAIAITGKSGAGKSTLIDILSGLDCATSGSITFMGEAIENMSSSETAMLRRDKIGIIFQDFNLISSWTALENVEAALVYNGLSKAERHEKAAAVLGELGLGDRLGNFPSELSVGEIQRVAVARMLIRKPVILFADEPTGSVDDETGKEIIKHLLERVKKKECALVIATHGSFPLEYADIKYKLDNGILTRL